MAQTTGGDTKDGEKIKVTVQKKVAAQNPDTHDDQDGTPADTAEKPVSKQAPTLQPSHRYLSKSNEETEDATEDKASTQEERSEAPAVSTAPAQRATAKLTPSEEALTDNNTPEPESTPAKVNEVDEYGQQTLTVADYAQQPPHGLAHEEQRDYSLSRRQLKRPPKGHGRVPAALLSALLLLVLCGIVAAGVYYVSQHSL